VESPKQATVQLFTLDGKEILMKNTSWSNHGFEINTTQLANGLYTVRISSKDSVTTKQVVVCN
jgi:hypothetical protein